MENEIWKPIVGYEGIYEVSNLGRVKSLERIIPQGKRIMSIHEKILKYISNKKTINYIDYVVYLTNKKKHKIHRLVAEAFIPNPENKPFINHIDHNPLNNVFTNLEWCTQKENMEHASKCGRMKGRIKYE